MRHGDVNLALAVENYWRMQDRAHFNTLISLFGQG